MMARCVVAVMRAVLAVVAGVLPIRWWSRVDHRLPMRELASVSGLLTMFTGFAVGILGFFLYLDRFTRMMELAVARSDTPAAFPNMLFGPLAPIGFALGTPVGLVATYLCVTGAIRAITAAIVDDPRGDPLLTLADALGLRARTGLRAVQVRWARERLEGREVPDQLVTGEWVGIDAAYVLLASRRKPGWEEGVFVLTADTWYRIGRAWDMPRPEGLRTAYPLTEAPLGEVLRKGVEYELPTRSAVPRKARR
jgi:hypothetical protein